MRIAAERCRTFQQAPLHAGARAHAPVRGKTLPGETFATFGTFGKVRQTVLRALVSNAVRRQLELRRRFRPRRPRSRVLRDDGEVGTDGQGGHLVATWANVCDVPEWQRRCGRRKDHHDPEVIRYSRAKKSLIWPAGTATVLDRVCLVCPNFWSRMNPTQNALEAWRKAASGLKARLDADYRNHKMLCNPWWRAAHSMAQGWRNIASQGRLGYVPQPQRSPTTWDEAARTMKASLNGRKQSRLLDQTTWKFWAAHVPKVELRYIPKRFQPKRSPAE